MNNLLQSVAFDRELANKESSYKENIKALKAEVKLLEQQLYELQKKLQPYQDLIYEQLQSEIRQLAILSELYKKYITDKKQKRKEQKWRGKNYKEPNNELKNYKTEKASRIKDKKDLDKPEIKKLYREAIIKIHPDKISHNSEEDAIQNATNLTAQLNKLYKNGDLDELKFFYYNLTNENLGKPIGMDEKLQAKEFHKLLVEKRLKLLSELEALKGSSLFYYFIQNKKPQEFVVDVRERLLIKIKKLKKRTRKMN